VRVIALRSLVRNRVFFKLLGAFVLLIAIATVVLDFAVRREWESSLRRQIAESLTEKTRMFAERVEANGGPTAALVAQQALAAGARATVIDATGRVLADSEADPAQMENHAARPEFEAALAGKVGTSSRTSKTLGIEFLYVAVRVPGGAVRLAYPLSLVIQSAHSIRDQLLLASIFALFIATLIAAVLAHLMGRRLRRMVDFAGRIATGDLSARISDRSYDEISQLAAALDRTARLLETSFRDLQFSKQQLETLLDSIPNPVIAVSGKRKVEWTNRAMQEIHPRIRSGMSLVELRSPDLVDAFESAISGVTVRCIQASSVVPGKSFNVTAAPIAGGGAVAVMEDMTEVERVEKTRRDFIANVSHELRTPLTSIKGFVETILDNYPSDRPDRQFLEIIQKNAARMARLTEDLLVLARVESGEDKLHREGVSVAQLLGEARDSFMGIAAAKRVKLEVEHAGDYQVFADKYAIQQVFGNLIENALKYSGSDSKVILGAQVNGIGIEFYVQDFGSGIAAEHLPRLFERFYRVDASRSRESGGTGLGLAIVKHVVMNHGGNVRVESKLGHGSVFFFALPSAD
jgi:two-component system phosphate regulon sensor histidine kinase PhoR